MNSSQYISFSGLPQDKDGNILYWNTHPVKFLEDIDLRYSHELRRILTPSELLDMMIEAHLSGYMGKDWLPEIRHVLAMMLPLPSRRPDAVKVAYWQHPVLPVSELLAMAQIETEELMVRLSDTGDIDSVCFLCGDSFTRHYRVRDEYEADCEWQTFLSTGGNSAYEGPGPICNACKMEQTRHRLVRDGGLRTIPYDEYLRTDYWKAKRERALANAGHRCQVCNSQEHLHVHHRTYANRGYEQDGDLTVLCERCHRLFHDNGTLVTY